MNWGKRIAIGYGAFVVFILALVVMAFQQDFDLVADDYYEQEIAYQERIDQMTEAKDDGQSVRISKKDSSYELTFSSAVTDVKVHFFRPSDDTKDVLLEEARMLASGSVSPKCIGFSIVFNGASEKSPVSSRNCGCFTISMNLPSGTTGLTSLRP